MLAGALRERVHAAFHRPDTRLYRAVHSAVYALILASLVLLVAELFVSPETRETLLALDRAVLAVFTVEIALRILSWRPPELAFFALSPARRLLTHVWARVRYALEPLNVLDLLAVVAIVPGLRGLRVLRLFRLARKAGIFRYANPLHGLVRAFEENSVLFLFAFSVLGTAVLVGGVTMYLVEGGRNPDIGSVSDALWWALVTLTTVGFGDIAPVTELGRLVGAAVMVGGLFTLALFAGIIGRTLLTSVLSVREEDFRMTGNVGHIVVCGYGAGARMLLPVLLAEFPAEPRPELVLFAPGERPQDLPPEFGWVGGDPTKESELDKVRLTHAAAVIVVGQRNLEPARADALTLLTLFTLRSYMARHKPHGQRRRPLYVVAEILDAENVAHARTAGADEVIETTQLGFSLLAHAVRAPGSAAVISRVAVTSTQNLYLGDLPEDAPVPGRFCDVAAWAKGRYDVLVLGVRQRDGRELLNPPMEMTIERPMGLVYLAGRAVLPPFEGGAVPGWQAG